MADKIWLKRFLVPLWTIQIFLAAILLAGGILGVVVVRVGEANGDLAGYSNSVHLANISAGLLIAFAGITIIFDLTEIILFARGKLQPVANLVLQCIKGLFWTVYFCLAIAAVAEGASGLSIIIALLLFVVAAGQVIYGGVIMHRHRKGTLYRGQYAPAQGSTAYNGGYNTGYNAPPFQNANQGNVYEYYNPSSAQPGFPQAHSPPGSTVPAAGALYPGYRPYQPLTNESSKEPQSYEMTASTGA